MTAAADNVPLGVVPWWSTLMPVCLSPVASLRAEGTESGGKCGTARRREFVVICGGSFS
jgi:hypothetical protein